ncbi:hypothetical protein [Bradyrhizobium pachyrhizi]|uniref:hypothetical protein n=1 Tax=Bradyrhizobium pachyrhizi TaxID=280333 RepID=UPI000A9E2008|nr:hypothetical protein [Bradyrhizobium pachyrhizi]
MTIIKSFAVGNGDTFYIRHASDNFTIIDCDLNDDNADTIIKELKEQSADKGITRFISTHPDDDHFGGIELLDAEMPILNFYVVENKVIKDDETQSFKHYCKLRDDNGKAFYIYKGCSRRWMNQDNDERGAAGISILWPDTSNARFKEALADGEAGISYNNMSAVIRYAMQGGASFLWLGDLETEFMESITDSIKLEKTTVVFAAHHGRKSGKIPARAGRTSLCRFARHRMRGSRRPIRRAVSALCDCSTSQRHSPCDQRARDPRDQEGRCQFVSR